MEYIELGLILDVEDRKYHVFLGEDDIFCSEDKGVAELLVDLLTVFSKYLERLQSYKVY